MKILVFLHGTLIMHATGKDVNREERVEQSKRRDPAVLDYENYIPIGNAVEKLKEWQSQGNEIIYLSSHETQEDVEKDKKVLEKYDFPKGEVLWRDKGQSYAEIAEKVMPNVLIEDDCESIGGEKELTYINIKPEIKKQIKHIVVKEFEGVDRVKI